VFVEVRTKTTDRFGSPEESINRTKMSRIRKTAMDYLRNNLEGQPVNMRFDVIAITFQDHHGSINHIKGAF
jgi:putative endonuclease